jgi:hypothetical protein
VSTLLHAFLYDLTTFAECIGTDCKLKWEIKKSLEHEILTLKNCIFLKTQEDAVKLYTPVSVQLICVNLCFLT